MRLVPFMLLILLCGCGQQPVERPFSATGELIALSGGDAGPAAACVTCHGLEGQGDGRETPRLAGLDAGYLHRQLDNYAAGSRDHAAMHAIAARLSAGERSLVSAYYAALPATGAFARAGAASPAGARLYHAGDPSRGLKPCAECHGDAGEGIGPGNPPLAGQSAAYLKAQLHAWREGRRHNDPLGEMREISRRLSPAEIRLVAGHAAALPAPRPPEAREASP